jgi:hypothetical protein
MPITLTGFDRSWREAIAVVANKVTSAAEASLTL